VAATPWRVVLVSVLPPAIEGFIVMLRQLGHAPVALVTRPRTGFPDASVAFPWLLPADALAVPRLGAVNVHPSLLPRYRGPNPVGWTFRNDDAEIGLTFHRMDDWTKTARQVHSQVRSWLIPSAGGRMGPLTELDGDRVRVTRTQLDPGAHGAGRPGEVLRTEGGRRLVQCGDRPLWVVATEPAE
jgi:methionyl-tRNA formyltransferase